MPNKRTFRKKSTDKKQTKRIKQLENFVYKTIENKQVNSTGTNLNVTSSGISGLAFLRLAAGVGDGEIESDPARIGNSVTLLRQQVGFNLKCRTGADLFNQIRIIVVESTEGSESLNLSDILQYSSYATNGDLVFVSPYTTKTTTNRRYKIHMDKTVLLTQDRMPAMTLRHTVKYNGGKVVAFQNNTDVIPTNHRLQYFAISDSTAVQHPRLDFHVRSTYKDA